MEIESHNNFGSFLLIFHIFLKTPKCYPHRNVLPELEVRQPGVLGLVDNDAVAGLVNIVVQPKIGRNPIREVVNQSCQFSI